MACNGQLPVRDDIIARYQEPGWKTQLTVEEVFELRVTNAGCFLNQYAIRPTEEHRRYVETYRDTIALRRLEGKLQDSATFRAARKSHVADILLVSHTFT